MPLRSRTKAESRRNDCEDSPPDNIVLPTYVLQTRSEAAEVIIIAIAPA